MSLLFEWDEEKADANVRQHRISLDEAQAVFLDVLSITVLDIEHSQKEPRFRILGMSNRWRLLVVSFTERDDRIRLISARKANRIEIANYEEEDIGKKS